MYVAANKKLLNLPTIQYFVLLDMAIANKLSMGVVDKAASVRSPAALAPASTVAESRELTHSTLPVTDWLTDYLTEGNSLIIGNQYM